MPPIRHICVATDGSTCADRAVDWAAELAAQLSAKLTIVSVANDPSVATAVEIARAGESGGDIVEANARRVLAAASGRARERGVADADQRILWGDVATAIQEIVAGTKADVVVVGRRGAGRLTRLLMGSVSQKMVALATCPVLVIP